MNIETQRPVNPAISYTDRDVDKAINKIETAEKRPQPELSNSPATISQSQTDSIFERIIIAEEEIGKSRGSKPNIFSFSDRTTKTRDQESSEREYYQTEEGKQSDPYERLASEGNVPHLLVEAMRELELREGHTLDAQKRKTWWFLGEKSTEELLDSGDINILCLIYNIGD
jgi:hypothetical protein